MQSESTEPAGLFRTLTDIDVGWVHYVVRAWLIAVVPSLFLFGIRVAAGQASLRLPDGPFNLPFAAYSIVGAPLLETALMVPLAWWLSRTVSGMGWRCFALAAIAACAHRIGGGWWNAAIAFWPFVIYSAALFAWRRRSLEAAYAVTTLVHSLYNATFFLFPLLALAAQHSD